MAVNINIKNEFRCEVLRMLDFVERNSPQSSFLTLIDLSTRVLSFFAWLHFVIKSLSQNIQS